MPTYESDTILHTKDKDGNQIIHYPITLDQNVLLSDAVKELAGIADTGENVMDGLIAILSIIANHKNDKNNPHGMTAQQVGALPLSGGILEGNLYSERIYDENNTILQGFYPYNVKINNEYVASITKMKDGSTQAVLSFNEFGIVLLDRTDSIKQYRVFGDYNKPSGSYIGNGDSTTREISIPELSSYGAVLIKSDVGCAGIVYAWGAFFINTNGVVTAFPKSVIRIETYKLIIVGTGLQYNNNGTKYYYQVL